jgi:hypothetical protein
MTTFTGLATITGLTSMVVAIAASEQVVITTQKSSGSFGHVVEGGNYRVLAIISSTGYVKAEWWDGSSEVSSNYEYIGEFVYAVFAKSISAPYDTSADKQAVFYASDASGNRSGHITKIIASYNKVSGLDVSTCPYLTHLTLGNTSDYDEPISGTLDLTGCSSLEYFSCSGTNLSSIDFSGVASLTTAYIQNNLHVTSLDVSGCTGLALLFVNSSTFTSLDVSTCSSLVSFYCGTSDLTSVTIGELPNLANLAIYNSPITSIDVSGCPSLFSLNLSNCQSITSLNLNGLDNLDRVTCMFCSSLSSIRAVGVGGGMYGYYSTFYSVTGGFLLRGCNLDEDALNQLYTDLSSTDGATILTTGNRGSGFDDTGIATAKGYTVMGSSPLVDQAVFETTLSSGVFGDTVGQQVSSLTTTTGRCKVTWWDGSSTTHGSGNPAESIQISKSISSPYNNSNSKQATVISCDSSWSASGHITTFYIGILNKIQSVDVSGCSYMTTLNIGGGVGSGLTLASLGLPDDTSLSALVINGAPLGGTLNLNSRRKLVAVAVPDCSLDGLDVAGCINLTTLNAELNNFTSIALAYASLNSLQNVYLRGGALTSVDLSYLTNLYVCYLQDNVDLTSVRATGVGGAMNSPYYYSATYLPSGINIANCSMTASALNVLYNDLSSTSGAVLVVRDNPGSSSDTPSLATAKGYTVIDT